MIQEGNDIPLSARESANRVVAWWFERAAPRKVRAPMGTLPGNAWEIGFARSTDSATENNRRRAIFGKGEKVG